MGSQRLPAFLFCFVFVSLHPVFSNAGSLDNWTPRVSGTTQQLNGVVWGKDSFGSVGDTGTILTSPDGIAWTSRVSGTTQRLNGVVWGKDSFVSVGDAGTILTSPDGVTWTSRSSGTTQALHGVVWGKDSFVSVGDAGTILTSSDGVAWTSRSSGTTQVLTGITLGNNIFVAVGVDGTLTSLDGLVWTPSSSGTPERLFGVTYGNGRFVAVGNPSPKIQNGQFVLVGGGIFTSRDGIAWTGTLDITPIPSGKPSLYGVTFVNGTFVAVGTSPYVILTSSDGMRWTTSRSSGTVLGLKAVTFGNNTLVAVGGNGSVLQSDSICVATLMADPCWWNECPYPLSFTLSVPYINYAGGAFWANFSYSTYTARVGLIDAGSVIDTTAFYGCAPATLSEALLLHIPSLMFSGTSYWLDLKYDTGITFTYSNHGVNY